jgi:site-specific DNA-methyltransferase (adenine-specific)
MIFTANQPFSSSLVGSNLQDFKYALVWAKTRNSHPFFAKIRPLPQHEDVLVFCRGKHIYNPQMEKSDKPYKINAAAGKLRGDEALKKWEGESKVSNERCPTSVIRISNSSSEAGLHPTQKPVALMEYLIRTYTNEDQTVLDNTMGSGTTGVACISTNRHFIGIERDPTYFQIAKDRISAAMTARAQRVAGQPS